MVENARKNPYVVLNSKRKLATEYIPIECWQNHFQDYLNKENKTIAYATKSEALTENWESFTATEVEQEITTLKNGEAAGSNLLFNKQVNLKRPGPSYSTSALKLGLYLYPTDGGNL